MSAAAAEHEDWIVLVPVAQLRPGHRFLFAEEFGGEGQTLTVESQICLFGTVEVWTAEYDFPIDFQRGQWVTLAGEEEA